MSSTKRTSMTSAPIIDLSTIRITALPPERSLGNFECGEDEIDRNLEKCNTRNRTHRARIFYAWSKIEDKILGFYCLAISASESKYLDEYFKRDDDFRPYIPFIYLSYIGVQREYQCQKIGTILMMDCLTKCERVARITGTYGVSLNALTDRLRKGYEKYGFRQFGDTRFPFMVLPTQALFDLVGKGFAPPPA